MHYILGLESNSKYYGRDLFSKVGSISLVLLSTLKLFLKLHYQNSIYVYSLASSICRRTVVRRTNLIVTAYGGAAKIVRYQIGHFGVVAGEPILRHLARDHYETVAPLHRVGSDGDYEKDGQV